MEANVNSMTHADRAEIVARTAFAKNWEALVHTLRVVDLLGPATDSEVAVAWLHDVVEDTDVDFVDLVDMGFPGDVIDAVRLVTRSYGSDYHDYKEALLAAPGAAGRMARKTKLADACQNLARCEAARGVPKWERLAATRYQPLIEALQALTDKNP